MKKHWEWTEYRTRYEGTIGEEMKKWAWEICRRVWRREDWPDQWREGEIVPILKKGDGERIENYRGVTLMPSMYKIYTILAERLKKRGGRKRYNTK